VSGKNATHPVCDGCSENVHIGPVVTFHEVPTLAAPLKEKDVEVVDIGRRKIRTRH